MRESLIEDYLARRVRSMGGEVRKIAWVGRRGAPDRLVMLPMRVPYQAERHIPAQTIWVELKATGVPAEDYQLREHARMRAVGQTVVVIDSLEGVDALLA